MTWAETAAERLRAGKVVRHTLPGGGRIHIERPLPFLTVYRQPSTHPADAPEHPGAAARLVRSQAAHLRVLDPPAGHATGSAATERTETEALDVDELIARLTQAIDEVLGRSGVVEVVEGPLVAEGDANDVTPRFRVEGEGRLAEAVRAALAEEALEGSDCGTCRAQVERAPAIHAADDPARAGETVRVVVTPIYRDAAGRLRPLVLLRLESLFTRALRKAACELSRDTAAERNHVFAFGRRHVSRRVWRVDRRLAEVSSSFRFLIAVTPLDVGDAWCRFRDAGQETAPEFRYRPLRIDPEAIKRRLYGLPIERIEDPVLAELFRDKQRELEQQIDLLRNRGSEAFLWGSLGLYGAVDDELLATAEEILQRSADPKSNGQDSGSREMVEADAMVEAIREAIEGYGAAGDAPFPGSVEMRDDIASGLMVSGSTVCVNSSSRFPAARVDPLIQHEVGTHLLTWVNGDAQRLRLLRVGMADYDALQEGLAVFAEYLVDGLDRPRMRLLAARVLACRRLQEGERFVSVYRELVDGHGYSERGAFSVVTRVFRGGGLMKDAVYLRGLRDLLRHLANGGELEPLYVGKIATRHIPMIEELRWRGVLRPIPFRPDCLLRDGAAERLERARSGLAPHDLIST